MVRQESPRTPPLTRGRRSQHDLACLILAAIFIVTALPARGSDESDLYDFVDNHLLLINSEYVERGIGKDRERIPCRHYFRSLGIFDLCSQPDVDFSRDGKTLFAAANGALIAVDLTSGAAEMLVKFDAVGAIKLSGDGRFLAFVTNTGVYTIQLADKTVNEVYKWPADWNTDVISLSWTNLAWNAASNQLLINRDYYGFWHYDLTAGVATRIEKADDAFFFENRVHVLKQEFTAVSTAESRSVRERPDNRSTRWILARLDRHLRNSDQIELLPDGWNTGRHYDLCPIGGSPYLLCRLGFMKNIHGGVNRNIYVLAPRCGWHVLVSRGDEVMPVYVENSRETMRLIRQRVEALSARQR